ncbi:MAG: NUDIX hydrolase [Deltaproteobacteria bacterium]|nr:NUDIX hydrolase [Deltaproteobacteria bacterium]
MPENSCNDFHSRKRPYPTADALIYHKERGIVLVKRRFPPPGWALPGGFIDYGESAETAAVREALEETGLTVRLKALLGVYSDPERDPRQHTLSVVYLAECDNPEDIAGGDDAAEARFFSLDSLPSPLAFDHGRIIDDFLQKLAGNKAFSL